MIDSAGKPIITDLNPRRGLRSAGEAVVSANGSAFVGLSVAAPKPGGASIRAWAEAADHAGYLWYGTPSLWRHRKIHLLCPVDAPPTVSEREALSRRIADGLTHQVPQMQDTGILQHTH